MKTASTILTYGLLLLGAVVESEAKGDCHHTQCAHNRCLRAVRRFQDPDFDLCGSFAETSYCATNLPPLPTHMVQKCGPYEHVAGRISSACSCLAATESYTPTATESPTDTATESPTDTITESPTDTATESPTDTLTEVPTDTFSETVSETATDTVTETPTDTFSETVSETATDTVTETDTLTESPTDTVTDTVTDTATDTVTDTATESPTDTVTESPTDTETATETPTETPTCFPTLPNADAETGDMTGWDVPIVRISQPIAIADPANVTNQAFQFTITEKTIPNTQIILFQSGMQTFLTACPPVDITTGNTTVATSILFSSIQFEYRSTTLAGAANICSASAIYDSRGDSPAFRFSQSVLLDASAEWNTAVIPQVLNSFTDRVVETWRIQIILECSGGEGPVILMDNLQLVPGVDLSEL